MDLICISHITIRIFILLFRFNGYNLPAKMETQIFHFWKFVTTDPLGTDLLQNMLVFVPLG